MPSRKITDLDPILQPYAIEFAARMSEAGLPFVFTCTYRSREEQADLYAQGRTKPGPIVTWTRSSMHNLGLAFDIAIRTPRGATWDLKVNVNENDLPDYEEAGRIGEALGLAWGGRWRTADACHFEFPASLLKTKSEEI